MPASVSQDHSRKRRKVDAIASPSSVSRDAKVSSRSNTGPGMSLDEDAVKRHMLELMSGRGNSSTQGAGDDSDSEAEDSEEDEEDDKDESDRGSQASTDYQDDASMNGADESGEESSVPAPTFSAANTSAPSRINVNRIKAASAVTASSSAKLAAIPKPTYKKTFVELGLSPQLIVALKGISIRQPTEIQSATFEPMLAGRDVIGGAKTGSGKTMAFALPILQRIARDPFGIFAVVLTPTRELAYQLAEQFIVLGKPLGLTTTTVVGGMDMMSQARELCGRPHVVVATPGRLVDLLRSGGGREWDLKRVKVLVLDEADRLLTPTFAPELQYLFSQVPEDRQTCLFTATISPAIEALAAKPPRTGKQSPFVHRVKSDTMTVANLKQNYLFVPSQIRDPYLYHLLKNPPKSIAHLKKVAPPAADEMNGKNKRRRGQDVEKKGDGEVEAYETPSTIIFTQRCATAHLLHLMLTELEIQSAPLHSHLTQPQRLASLAKFRAGNVPVLVTTDVGSRGLDIPEVAMVVNWDCPRMPEDYVHRVGRTARAGRGGLAITMVTERDVELVKGIEDTINVKLTELELPEETVLESLNIVSTARRVANLAMHDSGFGERQATNKAKAIKRQKRDERAARG